MPNDEIMRNAYRQGIGSNELWLFFPDIPQGDIFGDHIVSESMQITESVAESSSIEIIGCIASQFQIELNSVSQHLCSAEIQVYIRKKSRDGEEPQEWKRLFTGIVDDEQMQANRNYKIITAYDKIYTKGSLDVASWYKNLSFPRTIKSIRDSFFEYIGIDQVDTNLPNDNVIIEKQLAPSTLQALHVMKSICQINARFGIINREGKFEYRIPLGLDDEELEITEVYDYYKTIDYQDYEVEPVEKIIIRQDESDEGVTYGSGNNSYIIQGNMFAKGLSNEVLLSMAANIYQNVKGFKYRPFEADCDCRPWVECGKDIVQYRVYDFEESSEQHHSVYKTMNFAILNRSIKGIQSLRDVYGAEGDQYQKEFVSDLQTRVDSVADQVERVSGSLQDYAMNYLLFSNEERIIVPDSNSPTIVAQIEFQVQKPTQVLIEMEYLIDVDTTQTVSIGYDIYNDCEVEVLYYFDNEFLDARVPKEIYMDGKHILKMIYLLYVQNTSVHTWKVGIKSHNGTITIPSMQASNILVGQGLIGDVFDGIINAEDSFTSFSFEDLIGQFTDSANANAQIPQSAIAYDNYASFTFGNLIGLFTDSVNSLDKDMIEMYYGDGLTDDSNCSVSGTTWTGPGYLVSTDVYSTDHIVANATVGVEYQISYDDGETWVGFMNGEWVENITMTKSQLEAVTQADWTAYPMQLKAILSSGARVSSIIFVNGHVLVQNGGQNG